MGTSARIYVKNTTERGGYDSIRVNYDGMDVGHTLQANYKTPEDIATLLAMGECSALYTSIEGSIFYRRDRHEPLRAEWYRTTADVSEDYNYRWEGERWEVYSRGDAGWVEVERDWWRSSDGWSDPGNLPM